MYSQKELSRDEYVVLRRMFFQRRSYKEIKNKTGTNPHVLRIIAKNNRWSLKRERYYKMVCLFSYKQGVSILHKCNQLGLRYESVKKVKRKHKIPTKRFVYNKRITNEEKSKFISLYQSGQTGKEIAKKFGFATSKTVFDVLIDSQIKRRPPAKRTKYNNDYFKSVNSCDKAYILGLLLTDGYVLKNYKGVAIQLTISDKYLLSKISTRLGESCTVRDINCDAKRITMPNAKDMARLLCHCREISKDLKKIGVKRNKTCTLECPKISKKFLSSFFRGVWDGDGSIGTSNRKTFFATMRTKSKRFAVGLSELSSFKIGIYGSDYFNMYVKGGKKEISRFWKWLYSDGSDLFLRRKYEKVQNYIN